MGDILRTGPRAGAEILSTRFEGRTGEGFFENICYDCLRFPVGTRFLAILTSQGTLPAYEDLLSLRSSPAGALTKDRRVEYSEAN